jgi:DNA polymerase-3 subunit epsilon
MLQRWRHRRRCLKLARSCQQPVLRQYLESCASLNIGRMDDTPLIAADLELTGMDKSTDQIIALGWTLIDGGRIRIGSNRHMLIRADDTTVGTSAAYHELLDSEVAEGEPLEKGLEELFTAAQGRVWVFHHAGLDISFLKKACGRWAQVMPGFIVLDTLRIEYRLRRRRDVPVKHGDLQLSQIRGRYGLPRYTAHNALNDALATAELMLAIAAGMEPEASLDLAPHLKFF